MEVCHQFIVKEMEDLNISPLSSEPGEREDGGEISSSLLANQTAYNVSKLLDSLLHNYDNSLRPDFAGEQDK